MHSNKIESSISYKKMVTSFIIVSSCYAFACRYHKRTNGIQKKIIPLIMSRKYGNIIIHNTNPYIANSRINILHEYSHLRDISDIPKEKYAIIEDNPDNNWIKDISHIQDSKNMTVLSYSRNIRDSEQWLLMLHCIYCFYVFCLFIYIFAM